MLHDPHHLSELGVLPGQTAPLDVAPLMGAIAAAEDAAEQGLLVLAIERLEEALGSDTDDLRSEQSGSSPSAARRDYEQLHTAALEQLVRRLEGQEDYARAVEYARRLRRHDPVYEGTYQRLVHLYVLSADRAGALRTLQRRLVNAVQGRGSLVFICGPIGIGKTSLALACREKARALGAAYAAASCYERAIAPPCAPWHELFGQLRGATGLDPDALPEPIGRAPAAGTAYQWMQAMAESLQRAAAERPLVLLLDDLHWADQDTLDLLDLITRRTSELPLLVLVTYRSDQVHRRDPLYSYLPALERNRPVETIHLAPLSPAGTARLVEARHGDSSPELVAYLHDRSEGNPLFLIELLNDLLEQNLLARDDAGRWLPPRGDVPVPALIDQLITRRVDRLGSDAAALLEAAAVLGEVWDLGLAEAMLDWPEERLLRALEDALAAGLVLAVPHSRDRYQFAHGLTREVIYSRPLARQRSHLHARAAEALESRLPSRYAAERRSAELAHHFYRAGAWSKALRYGLAAGDAARARYASHSAAEFYEQALAALQQSPNAVTSQRAVELYERAGQAYMVLNQRTQAADAFEAMLRAACAADDRLAEARALSRVSIACYWLYRFDEARAAGERALQLAEQAGDRRLLALTHFDLGHLYVRHGDLVRAHHHLERCEALARASGEGDVLAPCLQNRAYIAFFRGDYRGGERLGREALSLAEAGHDALTFGGTCFVLGIIRGEQGQYQGARAVIRTGIERAEATGERHYLPKLLNTMGWLYLELGDVARAQQWDQRALEACRDAGADRPREAECYALLNLATDALYVGDLAAAEGFGSEYRLAAQRATYSRYRFGNRYQLLQAELALAGGDAQEAVRHAREAARAAEAKGMLKNLAKSHLYEGQAQLVLGYDEDAVASLLRAVALADQIGHGSLRWRGRLRLGQAYRALGRPNAEILQQATDIVQEIAADLHDERLRSTFLSSPLVHELADVLEEAEQWEKDSRTPMSESALQSIQTQAVIPDLPVTLTPRERQVLRLVVKGATNRDIAAALQISVKTVDTHVAHILAKTGCPNRTAAAAYGVQHGISGTLPPQDQ